MPLRSVFRTLGGDRAKDAEPRIVYQERDFRAGRLGKSSLDDFERRRIGEVEAKGANGRRARAAKRLKTLEPPSNGPDLIDVPRLAGVYAPDELSAQAGACSVTMATRSI